MDTARVPQTLLGVGIYSLSDAARYIHVSRGLMGHWVLGRQSRALGMRETGPQEPAARRTASVFVDPPRKVEGETVLTFAHLIELRLVNLFRKYGVSMPVIKAAARSAARLLETNHPFSSLHIKTDGKRVFAEISPLDVARDEEDVDENRIVQDLAQLQVVMGDIVRVYFKDTDYEYDMASRWWLLGKDRRAVLDPARAFGQPIDDETGVPLSVLYNLIKAGETARSVADWYDVPIDAVDTSVEFYNSLN
jgi:uncharacterized protein (DUF433 family)